jgi:hypothetical protein
VANICLSATILVIKKIDLAADWHFSIGVRKTKFAVKFRGL